jgi:polysaccharide pyruvyl transferase
MQVARHLRPEVDRGRPRLDSRPRRRRALRAARNLAAHAYLLPPSSDRVAYVGWSGNENMGDEAILAAYRRALHGYPLCQVSVRTPLARLDRLTPWRLFRAVLLGGGTLIGVPSYRSVLRSLLEQDERLTALMLGAGVEEPSYFGVNPLTVEAIRQANPATREDQGSLAWSELVRWEPVLRRFERVTVRGPRSRAVLRELGVDATVVGDPALLLADETPTQRFRERRLGLNIGTTPGVWGSNPAALISEVVAFARAMRARGWEIVLFPVWPPDLRCIEEAARRIGGNTVVFSDFLDLDRLFAAIRECHVFVGQKLHSVVFSSAVYVPSVMLEYHPKCADFHDSLGRSRYTIRTDRVTCDALVAAVDELAASRDAHKAALIASVGALRGRLLEEATAIRRTLSRESAR